MTTNKVQEQPADQVVIYQDDSGEIKLEVIFKDETVWLTQKLMANLFDCSVDNISLHLKNIFKSGELDEKSVVEDFSITSTDGKKYKVKHYNLDSIISVGYRVNSIRGTKFRIWATQRLREYIVKGFALNDDRFKSGKSMSYFDELQERIRQIRLSERFFYQKIKDIYKTSIDYDPKDEKTILFFKIVQNKLIWAISQQTAAELVYKRINANLPLLGMQSLDKKSLQSITKQDVSISKNYLTEDEIKLLGLLVEQYLAFAETMAQQHKPMYMKNWIKRLDEILQMNGRELLEHAGKISRQQMLEKSDKEYAKYKAKKKQIEKTESFKELEADIKELATEIKKK